MENYILSIDRTGINTLTLQKLLSSYSITIIESINEIEAIKIIDQDIYHFDLIVWNVEYIDDVIESTINKIKTNNIAKDIPIVIVSSASGKSKIIETIQMGASEYIVRPFEEEVFLKKICHILGINFKDNFRFRKDEDLIVFNFSEIFNREIKCACRGQYELSVVLARLALKSGESENLKILQDTLKAMNIVFKTKLRETDMVGLYSQDSSLILLPFTNKNEVKVVVDKLENVFITNTVIKNKNNSYQLFLDFVTYPSDGKNKENLLKALELKASSKPI